MGIRRQIQWTAFAALLLALAPLPGRAQGNKSLLVTPIAAAPSFAKRALVIGVQEYQTATPLRDTDADANAFAQALHTRFNFPDDAITLMTDDPSTPARLRPTYTRLRAAINALEDSVDTNSEVIVFYSGHGARQGDEDYLVPEDGDPADVGHTCISYTEMEQALETKRPHRCVLIVDACRNLVAGKGDAPSGFGVRGQDTGPEMAELFSCEPTQISQEGRPEDFQQGVFTHFLLQGLGGDPEAGEDGKITFDSLNLYVRGKVSQYVAHTYGREQSPTGEASLGGMILAQVPPTPQPIAPANLVPQPIPPAGWPPAPPAVQPGSIPQTPIAAINPTDRAVVNYVPPGEFRVGDDAFDMAKPVHTVYVDGYWIYKNVVTVAQYRKFCAATGHQMPSAPGWGWKDDHPIVNVTWNDAKAYCDWAGAALPTEAQWEKAARGTDGRAYPWGNNWDGSRLRWSDGTFGSAGGTTPVGSFPAGASPYGCLDMTGNIWRWCADWYDPAYYGRSPARNPNGAESGRLRMLRGGSWYNNNANLFRCAYRDMYIPGYSDSTIGFRCVVRERA